MRRASIRRPIRTQCKGDPHGSRQHAKVGEGSSVQISPNARPATGDCSRDHNPSQKCLAEAETPTPIEAQNYSQLVVLASIDLRSQHGRLVSARFSAISQKGCSGLMQQGRKSSGGQGLPDRAAEEQARTRGRKRVRKAFQGIIFLSVCCRFCPGTAYIVPSTLSLPHISNSSTAGIALALSLPRGL
jgi:hypothetical protein